MNTPVPPELHGRFDHVVDGGSIEHVFRPDEALANTMRMTKVGGTLIIWTPANNLCGHGFYQFSPEFFFSALSLRTGFDLEIIRLVECRFPSVSLAPALAVYDVRRPHELRERVGVTSRRPLMLLVRATKLEHHADPFAVPPQQSDYAAQWVDGGPPDSQPKASLAGEGRWPRRIVHGAASVIRRHPVGSAWARYGLGLAELRRDSLRNRKHFKRLATSRRRR
jgi:hypothetical protein